MISLIFVFMAAVLNALMDRVENENFSSSVFKNMNPKFWYKRESWKTANKIFGWKFDAWHVAKSLMIISLAFAIVLYRPILGLVDVLIIGLVWNGTFNIFYKRVFK
jgi:hypothetical protein